MIESSVIDKQLVDQDGALLNRPHVQFTDAEAALFRAYRTMMETRGLAEAVYCRKCWNHDLDDGCRAFVTSDRILIECRCTIRTYAGSSF